MYIGGGSAKRRRLHVVPGQRVRPTSSLVRQALFNVLRGLVEDAIFVDLFAGTGSVGLEALNAGARHVYFVESDRRALQALRTNIQYCGMTARAKVFAGALPKALEQFADYGPVDVLFLDPPYASDLGERTLRRMGTLPLLVASGTVIWQHAARAVVPEYVPGLALWQSRRYGDTRLSFYRPQGTVENAMPGQESSGKEGDA